MAFVGGTGALVERLVRAATVRPRRRSASCSASSRCTATAARHAVRRDLGGPGLDARLFTDLSTLQPDRAGHTDRRDVRAHRGAGGARSDPATWSIAPRVCARPTPRPRALRRDARPMGAHLIECSGNTDPDNFGLMSVAEWDGVPLARRRCRRSAPSAPAPRRVLVSGLDDITQDSRSSNAGRELGLPARRARTARRVSRRPHERRAADRRITARRCGWSCPGWYGCSWIKWVNEMRLVGADEPTTSQMIEFSLRTHQGGIPTLARDYEPPVIDLAATPIRVEKRRVDGRLEYRVVGIVWGGDGRSIDLLIRFSAGDDAARRSRSARRPRTHRTWSLWDYRWRPDVARRLQHRPARRRPVDPHAPPRCVVLRPPRRDRRSVDGCGPVRRCVRCGTVHGACMRARVTVGQAGRTCAARLTVHRTAPVHLRTVHRTAPAAPVAPAHLRTYSQPHPMRLPLRGRAP